MLLNVASVVLLLGLKISSTLACEGYEIVVKTIEVCDGLDSLVTLQNFSVSLTEDCKVVPSGCISHKAFTTAKISYDILAKSSVPLKGEIDLCDNMKDIPAAALSVMQSMKLSTSCPIPETTVCSSENTIVDISKIKDFLKLGEGTTRGEVKATFDTGAACLVFDMKLKLKDGAKTDEKTNLKELRKKYKDMIKNRGKKPESQE